MMQDSEAVLKARLTWVELYRQTGDAGLTCRRCGISPPTLRKWCQRYQHDGVEGLRSQSRRPHKLRERKAEGKPRHKVFANNEAGHQQLLAWLQEQPITVAHACLEATGTWADGIALTFTKFARFARIG